MTAQAGLYKESKLNKMRLMTRLMTRQKKMKEKKRTKRMIKKILQVLGLNIKAMTSKIKEMCIA